MEPDPPSFENPPGVPSLTALAILISISLIGVIILGSLWLTRYVPVHTDFGQDTTLTDAEGARFIVPILFGGLTLIALMWVATWFRARWTITTLPIVMAAISGLALIATFYGFWQSRTNGHDIVVETYICEDAQDRPAPFNDSLPEGCEIAVNAQTISLGTADDPDLIQPDTPSDTIDRFSNLPPGAYDAQISIPGEPDTASVVLAVETDEGIRSLGALQHQKSGTWSGRIALHPDLDTYYVLQNTSTFHAAPEASITFTVRECRGVSLAAFDPAACDPEPFERPIIEEMPVPEEPRGRPLSIAIDGNGMTLTNLEARSYTFTPTITLASMTTRTPTILILPADEPQTRENNVLRPDEAVFGAFTVDITGTSGPLTYNVYVFQESQTVALSADPLFDMRP
jgi:hypothetical protein